MRNEVIQILSDTQQYEVMKDKQYRLLQKQIQDEAALLKSPTSLILAVNAQFIPGTQKQKKQVLIQRIKKMYIDKLGFDGSKDFACVKREPNYNDANCYLVINQIIIYGTQFWPTRQIRADAQKLGLKLQATKIDDSHTKVKFIDYKTAKKWLQFYIKDKSILSTKMQQQSQILLEQQNYSKQHQQKIKGWFQLQPYQYQGFSRIRQARFCLNYEHNIKQLQQDIKTTSFIKFKQYVQNQLMKQQQAKIAYKKAQQRNFHNHKFLKSPKYLHQLYNQKYHNYSFTDRQYKSHKNDQESNNRNNQRSRCKPKNKNHYQRELSIIPKLPIPVCNIPSVINVDQPVNLSVAGNQIRDDISNYSFLLESNQNQDICISNALNKMTIEEQSLNLSIDLAPVSQTKPQNYDQNMSILLSPKLVEGYQKQSDKKQNTRQKESKILNSDNKINEQSKSEKIINVDKNQLKQFSYEDYLRYVQDSLKEEQLHRVREYKQNI